MSANAKRIAKNKLNTEEYWIWPTFNRSAAIIERIHVYKVQLYFVLLTNLWGKFVLKDEVLNSIPHLTSTFAVPINAFN